MYQGMVETKNKILISFLYHIHMNFLKSLFVTTGCLINMCIFLASYYISYIFVAFY